VTVLGRSHQRSAATLPGRQKAVNVTSTKATAPIMSAEIAANLLNLVIDACPRFDQGGDRMRVAFPRRYSERGVAQTILKLY
jgi:hypothetical protein